jgi:hypothetical protein
MKPMIWRPEDRDQKVNKYLDSINHEPWLSIAMFSILVISIFMFFVILGTF